MYDIYMDSIPNYNKLDLTLSCTSLSTGDRKVLTKVVLGWITHHGLRYTVERLKNYKTLYLQILGGNIDYRVPGIKMAKLGVPLGIYSKVFSLPANQALTVLNLYTMFIGKKLTKLQYDKIVTAVSSPTSKKTWCGETYVPMDYKLPDITISKVKPGCGVPWFSSPKKTTPAVVKRRLLTLPENMVDDFVKSAIYGNGNYSFIRQYDTLVEGVLLPEFTNERRLVTHMGSNFYRTDINRLIGGRLSVLQERGLKTRHIANPFRLFQAMCTPIGDFLYQILKNKEHHCVFDQTKGVEFVKNSFHGTNLMFSVDLSSATDRFPLEPQLRVIERCLHHYTGIQHDRRTCARYPEEIRNYEFLTDSYNAWRDLARSHWMIRDPDGTLQYLQWSTGQPLGLYPSFLAFTLTHVFMLEDLCHTLGLQPKGQFMVLGDDVFIKNERLYEKYMDTLEYLGVPISHHKSFCSPVLAEFAGKVIYKGEVIPNEKYSEFKWSDIYGPLRVFGIKGLRLIPSHVRNTIMKLCSLPNPYGLELNPLGITLNTRVHAILDKLGPYTHRTLPTNVDDRCVRTRQELYDYLFGYRPPYGWGFNVRKRVTGFMHDVFSRTGGSANMLDIEHYNANVRSLTSWDELPSQMTVPHSYQRPSGFAHSNHVNMKKFFTKLASTIS